MTRPTGVHAPTATPRAALRTVAAGVVSATAFVALAAALWIVNQQLAGPAGWSWGEVVDWAGRQPVGASFRFASAMATALAVYLAVGVVATTSAAAARALGRPGVARCSEWVAAPRLRRALAAAAGLGLTVAVDTPLALGAPPTATTPTTTAPIEPARSPASMPASEPGVATLELVDPAPVEPDSPAEARAPTDPTDPTDPIDPIDPPDATPVVSVWTIRPGDHLWGLATDALREHGREPSDREVADYVAVVVEQNRDALVVPGHPDLVLPGQVFVRPPLP